MDPDLGLDEDTIRRVMGLLIRSAIRCEQQLTILEADRSFVFFMETNSHGIVSMLTQASTALASEIRGRDGQSVTESYSVGCTLVMEWQARLEKIEKDPQVLQVAETATWATRTPLQWVYNEWFRSRKKHYHPAKTTCSKRTQSAQ